MGILEKIKEIEHEYARTQKNKATEYHLGTLKAKLAKLRTQLLEPVGGGGKAEGAGFEVSKSGDARISLIGFPSVGKSSLLSTLTNTESTAASYEFTTLTCIPGNIFYKGVKLQLLDLPGIIEGAAHGKGRGRQVISVAKSSDLVMMVLDAAKEQDKNHREILERELETVGLRLNKTPPDIYFKKKSTGGVKFNHTVPLTKLGADPAKCVSMILHEYKIHNCDILFREDCDTDQLIDVIEGNRKYIKCLYVYNKIDMVSIEECDKLARMPFTTVCSVTAKLNLDRVLEEVWNIMSLTRVYTKRKGTAPEFSEPLVLSNDRHGLSIKAAIMGIHRDMIDKFNYAIVWGSSSVHHPKSQRCGLTHVLQDEDVLQIVTLTVKQQRKEHDYAAKVQAVYDERKKKKKALKS